MIKTELVTKHTICCPHCGGAINNIAKKDVVNDFFKVGNTYRTATIADSIKVPTCISCSKKYEIIINSNDFTITIKETK